MENDIENRPIPTWMGNSNIHSFFDEKKSKLFHYVRRRTDHMIGEGWEIDEAPKITECGPRWSLEKICYQHKYTTFSMKDNHVCLFLELHSYLCDVSGAVYLRVSTRDILPGVAYISPILYWSILQPGDLAGAESHALLPLLSSTSNVYRSQASERHTSYNST